MRKLKRILLGMASKMGWQVMVTTHSPFLVDVAEDPCSLVVLRARSGSLSSTCQQLSKSPFESQDRRTERDALRAALDFHPTVCEAFFGNDTVLVEGASEMAILRHSDAFLEACGLVPAKTEDVSVVSCGGKWTILAMARLLKSFEIPIRVIHDGDRRSRSEDELEACRPIDPFRVNAALDEILDPSQLFACDDTLEDLLWPDREKHSTTNKPYQAWLRARQLVEEDLDLSNTHPELWEMVRFAFGGDDRRQ
ncbi:MAG: TOPRIM nucleotidyl transferase/hydrolase domain-containing protein [Acidobacteriota bacterium]